MFGLDVFQNSMGISDYRKSCCKAVICCGALGIARAACWWRSSSGRAHLHQVALARGRFCLGIAFHAGKLTLWFRWLNSALLRQKNLSKRVVRESGLCWSGFVGTSTIHLDPWGMFVLTLLYKLNLLKHEINSQY